ncbi:MAG: primosomal protein N' [Chloroflexi bacterium 13_1_40CM_68_21]|nr:MAG: primosomal protein N' [Chloroflexi bacterium 13_1_40CM_68_21]
MTARTAEVAVFAGVRGPARTFSYLVPAGLELEPGHLVRVGLGQRAVPGVVISLNGAVVARELRSVDALVHPMPLLRPHQLALAGWIAERYRCGLADAVRAMLPPALASRARSTKLGAARGERTEAVFAIAPGGKDAMAGTTRLGARQLITLRALAAGAITGRDLADAGGSAVAARALARRGLALEGRRAIRRIPVEFGLAEEERAGAPAATPAQGAAIDAITGALGSGRGFLLHGVTASGKTEVYLRAAAETLARGDGVIVLVPEIILTAQVVARFIARFGDRVALLHSALSAGERFDEWRRVLDGAADVVIGSRSALFAPLERVGLVVADEEQEPSYKQESDPRYHAVDAALALGRIAGCAVVLGSATPRVTTYQAARAGELTMLSLPERVGELPLPPTTVVDLRLELKSGNRGTLSGVLRTALQRTVARGEQAILYLNRRGFATVVLCRDCGYVAKCPACDIPYAFHLDGSLVCHRCGRREARAPERCPACGSPRIKQLGVGTQRVEEEVRAAVPRAKVIRLDRDAVRAKGSHAAAYERMRSGDAQVIVGTQMLAKGFDLPRVTLVGVVNADTVLNLPDFTAAERTFQLLTQVLGRSGRGAAGGRGILQTYLPEHYAIRAAAKHDYLAFAETELEGRRRFGYPPFGRLVLLSTQAKKLETVERRTRELAEWLREAAAGDAEVLGPAPAFAAKRAGTYRAQIVLRGPHPDVVLARVTLSDEWTVDVDPMTLLG